MGKGGIMTFHQHGTSKAPEPGPDYAARLRAHYRAVQARMARPLPRKPTPPPPPAPELEPQPVIEPPPPEPAVEPAAEPPERDWLFLPPDKDAPLTHPRTMPMNMRDVIRGVAAEYGLTLAILCGQSRRPVHTHPRQEAMLRLYETGRYSTTQIGRALGGRDHSTVAYGIRMARERRDGEPSS
jgi:hypothetical protein